MDSIEELQGGNSSPKSFFESILATAQEQVLDLYT